MEEVSATNILDTLYPKIESSFKNESNVHKLIMSISKYTDKWSHILLSTNFSERLLFSEADKNIIYEVTHITSAQVKIEIKKSSAIVNTWKTATNPFFILSVLIIRYFYINKKMDEFKSMLLYLAYPMFISSSFSSFRKGSPNADIMEYTINHLSNRYIIRQEKTINAMLEYTVSTALTNRYAEELQRCTDMDIKNIIYAIYLRIKLNVRSIAQEYYKNWANEKFIFSQKDNHSEENFHLADNDSYAIDRISSAVTHSIIGSGFGTSLITRSCNLNAGSSAKKVTAMLDTIIEKDSSSIKSFVIDIISLYLYKGNGNSIIDLKSIKFLSLGLQIFKSNAQDKITLRIKDKLLYWINMTSNKYGRNFISKGKTSLDTYKKTIFTCFIFKIIEVSKGGI